MDNMMWQGMVWVVTGLEITQQTNLRCVNKPSHQKLLHPWLPMKTLGSTISNSDLELAGHVAHKDVLASLENIDSVTVASYTNNTLALYWTKKGLTSTSIPAAYLLQLQALHQQQYYYHSKISHIAGTANVMADD